MTSFALTKVREVRRWERRVQLYKNMTDEVLSLTLGEDWRKFLTSKHYLVLESKLNPFTTVYNVYTGN